MTIKKEMKYFTTDRQHMILNPTFQLITIYSKQNN